MEIKRPGAGRPALPELEKKTQITVRLPRNLLDWLDDQELSRAKIMAAATAKVHNLCPDCFRPLHKFHNCENNPVK